MFLKSMVFPLKEMVEIMIYSQMESGTYPYQENGRLMSVSQGISSGSWGNKPQQPDTSSNNEEEEESHDGERSKGIPCNPL